MVIAAVLVSVGVTVVNARSTVAELLAVEVSDTLAGATTDAGLSMLVAVALVPTVALRVIVAVALAASVRLVATLPVPEVAEQAAAGAQVHAAPVRPAGSASVNGAPTTAAGPALVTVIVNATFWPTCSEVGFAVFVTTARGGLVAAAVGDAVAGIFWAASGVAFARFVELSTAMVAVYAGFAIFLAAMIWIYVSWLILLIGAQLSFYVQNPRYLLTGRAELKLSNGLRERIGLAVMYLVGRDHRSGEHRWSLRSLSEYFDIPGSTLADVTRPLEAAGLLLTTEQDTLVPGRDLHSLELETVIAALREDEGPEARLIRRRRGFGPTDGIADDIEAAIQGVVRGKTLAALIEERPRH